ncbi:hypothetical protein MNBD_ACTINO01-1139 [hydrothermal vent metagenome]|uniref:Uncharacterized protein n=1 Tax=hydrothermal vent metagenome TaxID=652676 RepID=A0A3B0SUU4_9ZZZZ
MTTRERTSPQIRPYLDVLETRIGDLSSDERTELLNDLEDHLEEILADNSSESLSDRIGSPDIYADEFVASIGIDASTSGDRSLIDAMSDAVRRAVQHVGSSKAGDIWEEMRPAWWTVRGLAIGLLLTWNYLWPGNPNFLWVLVVGATVLLPWFIWASMRVGSNRHRTAAWRWLSIAVTIAGVLAIFGLAANVSSRLDSYTYESGRYPIYMQESYPYGSLTEQDFQFMSETGMTPEEYFDSGYFQNLRESGSVPPPTTDPSEPPVIVTP